MGSWRSARIVHETRDLAQELNPSFSLVPRSQNDLAFSLAKGGVLRVFVFGYLYAMMIHCNFVDFY